MNTSDLFRLLSKRCQGLLMGVYPSDRLPRDLPKKRPLLLVCNTDPSTKPGMHWVAIYVGSDGRGEYFDSLGQEPIYVFERFLDKHCANYVCNAVQLQSVISRFCGHYCVFYCLFKRLDYSMTSIVQCFTSDTALNDNIVHKFVCDNL